MDLVGYDLDGTITTRRPQRPKPYGRQTGEERRAFDEVRRAHYRTCPVILRPEGRWVVISGRPSRYLQETQDWLRRNDLEPEGVYLLETSATRQHQLQHKLETIRRLGVTRYFEDDPKLATALARRGVCVVLVEEER